MSLMNAENEMRLSQHVHNSLSASNDYEQSSQSQHHSRSKNKNYRTPTSTPSFSVHNKQLASNSKNGYDEGSHPANHANVNKTENLIRLTLCFHFMLLFFIYLKEFCYFCFSFLFNLFA